MKVVILAGGLGTRISEENNVRPKPMVEIGGNPILWHIMKHFSYYGFHEFVICCGYLGHVIKKYFADYYLYCSDVTFDLANNNQMIVHSNIAEPWKITLVDTGQLTQTGGRVKRIKQYIGDEPFFLTYGDGVSDINLKKLLEYHNSTPNYLTISSYQLLGRFGVLEAGRNGVVSGFREKAREDGDWVNVGFMVAEPKVFDYINGDETVLEDETFSKLVAEGQLTTYKHYGYWQCMDTLRDRKLLESLWQKGNAPWKVWE